MNPGDKGWLRAYLIYRAREWRREKGSSSLTMLSNTAEPGGLIYKLMQPTGLMYGYPIRFVERPHPNTYEWSEKAKLKILLTEGFLAVGLAYHFQPQAPLGQVFDSVTRDILTFFKDNFRLYSDSSRTFLGRRKDPVSQLEYVLDRRISIQYDWRNFWTSFFHNSLLFFDLIFFTQWKEGNEIFERQTLKQHGLNVRLQILKVIAAAAHSDGKVTSFERTLFNFFLQSAHLPGPQKKHASKFLREGISLDQLDFSSFDSWILKKYFLELAILTIWAKREVSEVEQGFLSDFAKLVQLEPEDLLGSIEAVESFVNQSWGQVHYLQIKQNYRIVSEQMIQKMRGIVRKNQRMIREEVQESRELVYLLRQSTVRDLSEKEWEKVREQLLDILRSIPAFAIFMLPFGSITLPILLRIIPRNILYPSSFRENETRYREADREQDK